MADEVVGDAADAAADAGDAFDQMSTLLDEGKGESGDVDEVEDKGDDDELPITPDKKDKGEADDKADDDEDEEEEEDEEYDLDDEEEADLEDLAESEKPRLIADVEKKYPKFFKEFKGVRSALLREQAFTQVFSHPKEAQELVELNEGYRTFETEVLSGNGPKVLKAIKDTNEAGYQKFVASVLPTLQEHDQATYLKVTLPVIADILTRASDTGVARGDKNLVNSVKHLASMIWPSLKGGVPKVEMADTRNDPAIEARLREVEQRERAAAQRDTTNFIGGVRGVSEKQLRRRIEKGLDPQNALSPFLKKSVVDHTISEVKELLDNDVRFNQVMTRIFERAKRSGFGPEYRTRLVGTYIGRAANLIGPIRKRHLLAALGRTPTKEGGTKVPLRRDVGEGTTGGGKKSLSASSVDFNASSDMDIMAGKAKLKK